MNTSCKVDTYCCKLCARQKGTTNHWYILCAVRVPGGKGVMVSEWNDAYAQQLGTDPNYVAACGDAHATKLFTRWLENKTFETPGLRSEPAPNS